MSGFSGPSRSVETIFWEYTNAPNPANTNHIATSSFAIPANLLSKDGDELILETDFIFSSATSTKGYGANIGHSSFSSGGFSGGVSLFSNGTATASQSMRATTTITRTGPTEAQYRTFCSFSNTQTSNVIYATSTVNWSASQNIATEVFDVTGNAGAITIKQTRLTLRRAP
ncbi:hypothetical protein [Tardiphaga sp.]|jgi:hypothetical protein|uniref:hypothetical protein n=1 Tax=Tardiphaga sp. TaxID=1926292 RepID=UPI0037D9A928